MSSYADYTYTPCEQLFDIERLFGTPFEEDLKWRSSHEVLTSLLQDQVPVLGFVNWRVAETRPGFTRSLLPLIPDSTNQHCTHQAALMVLAADYTGGIALGSLFPGWPVIGVHPVSTRFAVALWLVKVEIKYLRPSTAELEIVAEIEPERQLKIARRFLEGRPVVESVPIRCFNHGVPVAEATLTYFARQSEKLRADGITPDKVNILYEHKLVSAAELIAGVRAKMNGTLFHDPYAHQLAGEHGIALAERFLNKSPQLGGMVSARTRHLDAHIEEFALRGRQIVLLGVGYDMRPFRMALPRGTRIYELDLPTMLRRRVQALNELGIVERDGLRRLTIPIDLRTQSVFNVLKGIIDPDEPVFIAWEGSSMYFDEREVCDILSGIRPLLQSRESKVWIDFVDARAISEPDVFPEVRAFMDGMQLIGEPFIFGPGCVEKFMTDNAFQIHEIVSSGVVFDNNADPVYGMYSFCVASGDPRHADAGKSWRADPATQAFPPPLSSTTEPSVTVTGTTQSS
jgi:methyltransferase (TIGR00027 family)